MARGDQFALNPVGYQLGLDAENWTTDSFEARLVSDTYAASQAFETLAAFTEVSGGSYAAQSTVVTWTRSGGKSTLQADNVSWALDASGPQNIRCAILVNATASTVITVTDLTLDGTTPVDNQAVPINVNYALTPTLEIEL